MELQFSRGTLSTSARSSIRLSVGFLYHTSLKEIKQKGVKWVSNHVNYLFPHEWMVYKKDCSSYPYIVRVVCKLDIPDPVLIVLNTKIMKWGKPARSHYSFIELDNVPEILVRVRDAPSLWVKTSGKFLQGKNKMLEKVTKTKQTIWW